MKLMQETVVAAWREGWEHPTPQLVLTEAGLVEEVTFERPWRQGSHVPGPSFLSVLLGAHFFLFSNITATLFPEKIKLFHSSVPMYVWSPAI